MEGGRTFTLFPRTDPGDVFPIHVNISQYPAPETNMEAEEHETE